MDPARALYTDDGDLVCVACHSAASVAKSYAGAARATAYAAFASGIGTTAFAVIAPFVRKLGVPLVALGVVGTWGSFRLLGRPEYRKAAGDSYGRLRAIAGAGVVLSVVGSILMIVLVVAAAK